MNDWKSEVARIGGDSDEVQAFIKSVEFHLSTYRAVEDAWRRFPHPAETFRSVGKISETALSLSRELQELSLLLEIAPHQVRSNIAQGALMAAIVKDESTGNVAEWALESHAWLKAASSELHKLHDAAEIWRNEVKEDDDVKRLDWGENNARDLFVLRVAQDYESTFSKKATHANEDFMAIAHAIFSPIGIPTSNLERDIKRTKDRVNSAYL